MSAHDLSDVKIGDAVAVHGEVFNRHSCVKRIVKATTKNQVTLDDGSRWLRLGRKVGADTWTRVWAKPWDEKEHADIMKESIAESERQFLRGFFEDSANRIALTQEQRTIVITICNQAKGKKSGRSAV